ncbi:MAG: hypothetical protein WCF27_05205 [Gaiellaceae bacterium]
MRIALALAVLLLCGCGSHLTHREVLRVHVRGPAQNLPVTGGCFLLLQSNVVGGGWMTYCLERFINDPGPNVTVLDSGRVTFALPTHTVRARVQVTTKFGPDGEHAIQKLRGTVSGGGTIVGGGPYVEAPPGRVGASDLRYTIRLRG